MHEASLVHALLSQVDQLARSHGGGRVTTIRVQVGPLSGVEPLLFDEAFRRLAPGSIAERAELIVDYVPLGGVCRGCGETFTRGELEFTCPLCGSHDVTINSGDCVLLESIALETV